MAFIKIAETGEVPAGSVIEVMVAGEPVAVCNVAGEIHVLSGTCPHQGGPLGQGAVNGNYVTCPWHGWDFDCRTGQNDLNPTLAVEAYPVRIEAGSILADIPNA